jgi:hypothetical protein
MLLQRCDDRAQLRQRVAEERASRPFRRARRRQRGGDLRLRPGPDPGVAAQLLCLSGRLQRLDGRDPELAPDPAGRLRPQAGQAHERRDLDGHLRLALGQRVDLAVLDRLDDLRLDRLADPLEPHGLPVERELGDGRRRLPDARGRLAVRAEAEGVASVELDQVGEQVELLGEHIVPRQFGH